MRGFREAKKQAATHYAEQAVQIVDDVREDRDAIAKAREMSHVRRWLAGAWDRELYGEAQSDINVNVLNMADAHLDALRHRVVETPRPLGLPADTTDTDDALRPSSGKADDDPSCCARSL